jgi:hypothetical protein
MDILISKDKNFLYFDGKVANIATNNSVDLSLISITEIIDIFKSQSTSLLRENNNNLIEINSIIRSIGHLINEDLNFEDKQFFLFELENKLSNNLLVESIDNTILITEQAWDWIKDKAGKAWDTTKSGLKSGLKWVGNKLSDVGKYLWTQGLPWFFDKLREFCYSPIGVGLDVALTVALPAAGKVIMSVVWGALLIWEVKELIDKGPSFETIMNVIFAAIGVLVPALSKAGRLAIGTSKSLGALPKASRGIITKILNTGKGMIGKIISVAEKGAVWLASLFGSRAKSWMSGVLSSLKSSLTKSFNSVGKKMVGGRRTVSTTRVAAGLSQGLKAGLIFLGIDMTLKKFLETETGKNLVKKLQKLFGYTDEQMTDDEFVEEGVKRYIIVQNPNLNLKDSDKIEIEIDEANNKMIVTVNGKKYKNKNNLKDNFILIPYESNEKEEIVTDFDKNWDYMKKNNQYFAKRKNSTNWILTKGEPENSIKNKVFNLI